MIQNKRKTINLVLVVVFIAVLAGAFYFLNQRFHFLADVNNSSSISTPTCLATVNVPDSIDATGATDVSSVLNSFIASVPDNSIIKFKAGGRYKMSLAIKFAGRNNLIFDGNGATLQGNVRTTTADSMDDGLFYLYSTPVADSNIVIKNFKLKGGDTTNPGHYPSAFGEHQMAFIISSAKNVEIHDVEISGVYGDGFYINGWSDNIYIHNNHVITADRMAVTIIAGSNILVRDNLFDKMGYYFLDVEPNNSTEGAKNVQVLNNTIGSTPGFFAGDGDDLSVMSNITVSGNTALQSYLTAFLNLRDSAASAITRRQNITYTNNTSELTLDDSKYPGNVSKFKLESIDGVNVYGNAQPVTSGGNAAITDFTDSTNVVATKPAVAPAVPPSPAIESLLSVCRPVAPPCLGSVNVPADIDSTGLTDVSAALLAFINSVPDGSKIVFKKDGVYRIDSALQLISRHFLTFDGNGATIKAGGTGIGTHTTDSLFYLTGAPGQTSDITFENFNLVGNSTSPGTYIRGQEYQMAFFIRGVTNVDIHDNTISNIWGDGFYVTGWADTVNIHNNHIVTDGRDAVTIIAGKNVYIENNAFDKSGSVLDIESNYSSEGANNIQFINNTIGTYYDNGGVSPHGYFFAANGADSSTVQDIIISGNTLTGSPLYSVVTQTTRRKNITFTNNTSNVTTQDGLQSSYVLIFKHVDGLTVYGNNQSLGSNSNLFYNQDCTNVITDPNIAITNTLPLTLKPLTEVCPLPPVISSINITENQVITTNPYIISAQAKDAAETLKISKVEFYVDDNLIGTSTLPDVSGRYQAVWDTSKYHSAVKVIIYGTDGSAQTLNRNTTVQLSEDSGGSNLGDQIISVLPNTGQDEVSWIDKIQNVWSLICRWLK